MEAPGEPLGGPGPALTSLMECRSIAYDLQLAEEQRAIARKVAAQPWPQSALALRQMDTFASPRCTPEWLHRSWEGDASLLAVAAEVEATAEAARLSAPSQTRDGPRALPVAGALPDLGVPVAGLGTVGMDPGTAAAAYARAAQACGAGSEGAADVGQGRVPERGSMESAEAVLLFSALLQSRIERWREGGRGVEQGTRSACDAAGKVGVGGEGDRDTESHMRGGAGREGGGGGVGGGEGGAEEGPPRGPGSAAASADTASRAPQALARRGPALRWLPPPAAKGSQRCSRKRPRGETRREEAADQRDQRDAPHRRDGESASQDATDARADDAGRGASSRCANGFVSGEIPMRHPGEEAEGEDAGEQAWLGMRSVCDEGAMLAWRLVGQQLLRRAQEAGCLTPGLAACLQDPRTVRDPSAASQQAQHDAQPLLLGGLAEDKMHRQLSTLLATAGHLTPRTKEAIASRLKRDLGGNAHNEFQLLHP